MPQPRFGGREALFGGTVHFRYGVTWQIILGQRSALSGYIRDYGAYINIDIHL